VTAGRVVAGVAALGVPIVGAGLLAGRAELAATAWALAAAAVVAVAAVRRLAAGAAPVPVLERAAPDTLDVEQLRQVSLRLEAARTSSHGVERELRPLLRTIAAARLARRGVDLDRHMDAARQLLGPELWEVVGPGGGRGGNRVEGGIADYRLRALIEHLEAV
jgi:hypothetical protein